MFSSYAIGRELLPTSNVQNFILSCFGVYLSYSGSDINRQEIQLNGKKTLSKTHLTYLNRLTTNDPYMGRTAPLTSKRCTSYIYSTNIDTEYFKHALYSPCFSLQNAVCFIMLTCLVPVLFTIYIQVVLKLKK